MFNFKEFFLLKEWGHATFDHELPIRFLGNPVRLAMIDLRLEDYGQSQLVRERWVQELPKDVNPDAFLICFGEGKRKPLPESTWRELEKVQWGVSAERLKELWDYGGITWGTGKFLDGNFRSNPLNGVERPVDERTHPLYRKKQVLGWWDFALGYGESGIVKPPAIPRDSTEAGS